MPDHRHPAHAEPVQRGADPAGLSRDVVAAREACRPPVAEQVDTDDTVRARQQGGLPRRRKGCGARAAAPERDAYFLLQGTDRDLLVPDPDQRRALWTPRVWPGGLLVGGEIAGTWRRADTVMTVQPWRRLSRAERDAVAAEAESLPLPGIRGRIVVRWDD